LFASVVFWIFLKRLHVWFMCWKCKLQNICCQNHYFYSEFY
jgi:hypothetical protein